MTVYSVDKVYLLRIKNLWIMQHIADNKQMPTKYKSLSELSGQKRFNI